MLPRKTLMLLGIISLLSYASCARSRSYNRNNNYNNNNNDYYDTNAKCEGEGCLSDTAVAIIFAVVIVACVVIIGIFIYCKYCRNDLRNRNRNDRTENVSFTAARRPEPTVRTSVATSYITTTVPQKPEAKAVFSSEALKMVETPCDVTDEEQMTMYRQDQIWLEEVAKDGRGFWKLSKGIEYQNDLQGKKNLQRFSCMYGPRIGGGNRCNGCRESIRHGKWYRCRECLDVDFCVTCFVKGPTISAYGHVPGHECVNLKFKEMCFICKGLIYYTRMECGDCPHVYFCLGCYNTGRTEEGHNGHFIKRIEATSYVMVKAADAWKESASLLPPSEKGARPTAPPMYQPGGAENVPMMSAPEVPPPAYDECT